MPHPFRSEEVFQAYEKVKTSGELKTECKLCKISESIKDFKHWRIVSAKFPYDKVAEVHHMLIPKKHTVYEKLTPEEKTELESIRATHIETEYEFTMEATNKQKSIPEHLHIHLIICKRG